MLQKSDKMTGLGVIFYSGTLQVTVGTSEIIVTFVEARCGTRSMMGWSMTSPLTFMLSSCALARVRAVS